MTQSHGTQDLNGSRVSDELANAAFQEVSQWHLGLARHEELLAANSFDSGFAVEAEKHALKAKTHRYSAEFVLTLSLRSEPSDPVAWQPIETAPKDGTMILVSFGDKGVRAVSWDSPYNDPVTPENGIWCVDDDKHGPYALRGYSDEGHNAPDGWKPMPISPLADGEAK